MLEDYHTFARYRAEFIRDSPSLLSTVTDQYRNFIKIEKSNDVKSFIAYQAACRAALSHLQLLIRVATWAQANVCDDVIVDDEDDLNQLILDARTAIRDGSK